MTNDQNGQTFIEANGSGSNSGSVDSIVGVGAGVQVRLTSDCATSRFKRDLAPQCVVSEDYARFVPSCYLPHKSRSGIKGEFRTLRALTFCRHTLATKHNRNLVENAVTDHVCAFPTEPIHIGFGVGNPIVDTNRSSLFLPD